ncbi:MAG: helix-turn-helix domain-containing protein [Clostridium sp.]|jgi:AraC-like DNA-binding protein|nr:helix-turn-helix domain-containing protein [Clostridium sp.]
MDSLLSKALDDTLLTSCREKQLDESFRRIVDGDYELVDYLPGSSMRLWVNEETCDYDLHWHPAVEMIMPLENSYRVIVKQVEYNLDVGDILIIPAGELHHLFAPPTGIRLIYLFDFSALSNIKAFSYLNTYLSQPIHITERTHPEIYDKEAQLIIQMCKDYNNGDRLRELLVYARVLEFFAHYGQYRMAEANDDAVAKENPLKHKELLEKLNKAFEFLDSHYTESVTLENVASAAGFSKFHFSRMFKQCSGHNFYDYLCYRRIKSAESLLLNPNLSITEIALQSGFSSLSTFNRTFKRTKNCTPSEYRNLYSNVFTSVTESNTI